MNVHAARVIAWVFIGFFSVAHALASGSAWTGAADSLWTNSVNWGVSPFPSGDDTATFVGAGNARTTLDTAGLSDIKAIVFDGLTSPSFTLGAGALNSQTLTLRNNGTTSVAGPVRQDQCINAALRLGSDIGTSGHTFQNDSPYATLRVAGNIAAPASGGTAGAKTLNVTGCGKTALAGNLSLGGAASLNINVNGAGPLVLSGTNTISTLSFNGMPLSVLDIGPGLTTFSNGGSINLTAYQDAVINGSGAIALSAGATENPSDNSVVSGKTLTINCRLTGSAGFEYWHGSYYGTILLYGTNDFTGNVFMNAPGTIGVRKVGNKGSTDSNLGTGTFFRFSGSGARLLYTGTGETSDRTLQFYANGVIEQSGSGNLAFTAPLTVTSGSKSLTLQGSTSGTGEFSGVLQNDLGTLSLVKTGSGLWSLTTNNTYTGTTTLSGGTLRLAGASGAIAASSAYALSGGGTLLLDNTATANLTNRLSNSAAVSLAGGSLLLSGDAGAADFYEAVGAVTVSQGANVIAAPQAAAGRAATLALGSLTRTGGSVNFVGAGLGTNTQCRILIAGQAAGLIGAWATYNGSQLAAYDSTLGVIPAPPSAYTDIAALGSTIANAASSHVRVNSAGSGGSIALSDATTAISSLLQNTATEATVDTAAKSLQVSTVLVPDGMASVTLGTAAADGTLAAPAGAPLLLANFATNASLTVNAALANNGTASTLAKIGAGAVLLRGPCAFTGVTHIASGTLTFDSASAQTLLSSVTGPGALAKTGTNRLTLAAANTYAGETRINTGTVVAQNNAAFGSSATGTVIASGATLDLGGSLAANALTLGAEPFTVSGAGVDGLGAIVNTSGRDQYNALSKLALAGDTTFGGTARWDMRNSSATLDMNNFNITKTGTNYVGLTSVLVNPGTGCVDVAQGTFTLEAGTTLNGSATNRLTVRGGTSLDMYNLAAAPVWSLAFENGASFNSRAGWHPLNTWAGPVTLNGTATLTGVSGTSETLSGPISGSGSLVKNGAGTTAYLTSDNNTYAGNTLVSNGTLFAYFPGSLSGYSSAGRVSVAANACLTLRTGDGTTGWNSTQIDALRAGGAFAIGTSVLALDTTLGDSVCSGNLGDPLTLTKQGDNVLTLTGANTYSGVTRINGGLRSSLTFANASPAAIGGNIYVNGGTLGAALNVNGPLSLANSSDLYVGNNTGDRASVGLTAAFTLDDFQIGWVTGAAGAVLQSGGTMTSRVLSPGATGGGYGYYRLSGGTATVSGYLEVGTYGTGVMDVFSGTLAANNCFDIDRRAGGMGVLTVSGGTVNSPSNGNPLQIGRNDANAANGQINVMGSGVLNAAFGSTSVILDLSASTNASTATGIVNLLGGTLIANRIGVTKPGRTLLNFNGGLLRVAPATTLGATFLQGLAAATVYPGGAVLDTTNVIVTVAQSLLAPTGYGVASLSLTNSGAGYIGAPAVVISGGSGTGATAIASVDLNASSATYGKVTALQVTCPGTGYQSGDAVAVTLVGGGYTALASGTAALGANASGGLTKLGSGQLLLTGTNTYAGATIISNGTLRLGSAVALSASTAVKVVGNSTYDLNGYTTTNGALTVANGTVINGTLSGTAFDLSGNTLLSASLSGTGNLTVAAGSTTTVSVAQLYAGNTSVSGTLNLLAKTAGLFEGAVSGDFNKTDSNPKSAIQFTTRYANLTTWPSIHTTYIYSGYIWNQASTNETWTFAENFDDSVQLKIDGNTLLDNGTWNAPTRANVTLTPGCHAFEARFGQGDGGVGPNSADWWKTTAFGFGVDFSGRNDTNIANYVALTDPGNGSLLSIENVSGHTNMLPATTAMTLTSGSLLNLGGNVQTFSGLSGSGTVSNGALTVNGVIVPGGTGAIGTLSLNAATTLSGTLLADVSGNGSSDLIAGAGSLTLANLTLQIANPAQLNRQKAYTLVTCSGARTGTFASVVVPDSRWRVLYSSDGTVRLVFVDGTLITVR